MRRKSASHCNLRPQTVASRGHCIHGTAWSFSLFDQMNLFVMTIVHPESAHASKSTQLSWVRIYCHLLLFRYAFIPAEFDWGCWHIFVHYQWSPALCLFSVNNNSKKQSGYHVCLRMDLWASLKHLSSHKPCTNRAKHFMDNSALARLWDIISDWGSADTRIKL